MNDRYPYDSPEQHRIANLKAISFGRAANARADFYAEEAFAK